MMKVVPTVEGGLRIEVGTATDWLVLEQIAPDALKMKKESRASRLSALMDEASEWDEMVVPELSDLFNRQLHCVQETVQGAQKASEEDPGLGHLFISQEDGPSWYGALNQARIALEGYYRFGPAQEIEEVESFPPPKRSAFIRSQFYSALQSVLLEHVIE